MHDYIEYPKRWSIIVLYGTLLMFANGSWLSTAVVDDYIAEYYNLELVDINLISSMYYITYILASLVTPMLFKAAGVRAVIIAGAMVNAIGLIVCIAYDMGFGVLMAGNVVSSLSGPFLLNYMTTIGARWFNKKEFSIAIGLLNVMGEIGSGLGLVVPSYTISSVSDFSSKFYVILIFWSFGSLLAAGLIMLFFDEKPPTDPAKPSQEDGLYTLFNPAADTHWYPRDNLESIWILFAVYWLRSAVSWTSSTSLGHLMRLNNYSANSITLAGVLFQFVGIPGPIIAGFILRTEQYLVIGLVVSILCLVDYFLLVWFIHTTIVLYITIAVFGLLLTAWSTILFVTVTRMCYPLSESASNEVMMYGANGIAFGFGIASSYDVAKTPLLWTFVGMLGLCVVGQSTVLALKPSFDPIVDKDDDNADTTPSPATDSVPLITQVEEQPQPQLQQPAAPPATKGVRMKRTRKEGVFIVARTIM
jgi:MFS family permease